MYTYKNVPHGTFQICANFMNRGCPGGSDSKESTCKEETHIQPLGWEDPLEKEWEATPIFLPRESYRQRSLVGYSPWGRKDTTERLIHTNTLREYTKNY